MDNFSATDVAKNDGIVMPIEDLSMGSELIYSAHHLLQQKTEEPPQLWGNFIRRGEISLLVGPGDVGKSIFLRDMASRIVGDYDDFLGFTLKSESKSVLYVALEDSPYTLKYQFLQKRLRPSSLRRFHIIDSFFGADPLKHIESAVSYFHYDCIFLDPITSLFFGDSNDMGRVRQMLTYYNDIAKKYNVAIVMMTHIRKDATIEPPQARNVIGSQGYVNFARTVMEMRRRPSQYEQRCLFFTKANGLDDEYKKEGFALDFFKEDFSYKINSERVAFEEFYSSTLPNKYDNKKEILAELKKSLDEGLSQADAIRALEGQLKGEKIPSLSTLKNWCLEMKQ